MYTKDLITQLVKTSFKLRYNNSILGFVWVFIKPFVTFLVNYIVWTTLFQNKEDHFAMKLMLGIMMWTFVNEGIIFGMNGLLDKAGIILKVNFPRYTAIIASTLMSVINFIINIILFFIIFSVYNISTNGVLIPGFSISGVLIAIFGLFLSMVTTYLFCLGVSYFLSIVVVRVRDLQHILELFFAIAFWFTPVLVSGSLILASNPANVNSPYYIILMNNPIGWIIDFARNTVIFGNFNGIDKVLWVLACVIILSILGSYYFERKVKTVAEYF